MLGSLADENLGVDTDGLDEWTDCYEKIITVYLAA